VAPSTESHCSNEVIDANDARHRSQLEKLFAKTMNDSELSRYSVKFLYLLKLYRTSAHWRVILIVAILSVCHVRPSVRLLCVSVAFRHSVETACILSPHGIAQSCYFYEYQTLLRNSDGVTPFGGAKHMWGIKISRFSTNSSIAKLSLYLANDTSLAR